MSTPRLVPGTRGVKTAWTDPEHVRLTEETPEERVSPKRSTRLRAADPEDPWAVPLFVDAVPCPGGVELTRNGDERINRLSVTEARALAERLLISARESEHADLIAEGPLPAGGEA